MTTRSLERAATGRGALALSPGWATTAPLLCAIHCAATPLLVVVAPALSESFLLEIVLFGASLVLSVVSLGTGIRNHGRSIAWAPVALGLVAWAASLLEVFVPLAPESVTTLLASLTVAGGLLWNARFLSAEKRAGCHCTACDETTVERGRTR